MANFARDIVNFLNGRDVMVAREVDAACKQMKESGEVRGDTASFFNQTFKAAAKSGPEVVADLTSPRGLATLDVMMRPEFSDVRTYFEAVNKKVQQSLVGFENSAFLKKFGQVTVGQDLTVKLRPEQAQAIICSPGIMDPLVSIGKLPPVDPARMTAFETAVAAQQKKLEDIEAADEKNNTSNYDAEINRIGAKAEQTIPAIVGSSTPKP